MKRFQIYLSTFLGCIFGKLVVDAVMYNDFLSKILAIITLGTLAIVIINLLPEEEEKQ